MAPDTVVLETFYARVPFGEAETKDNLWEEIDEQSIASETRRRLAKNGFRVGIVGAQVPAELAKLLALTDRAAPSAGRQGTVTADLEKEPRVVLQHTQVRAEHPVEILASDVYDRLPVLVCNASGVTGQIYFQAQGLFVLTPHLEPDRRVRLELVPELRHGESKSRFVPLGQAGFRLDQSRSRQAFDDLSVQVTLLPGQMVVLSSLASRPGSLGHYFFTREADGRLEQKLVVIRLAQTQHDGLFNPQEPRPLNVSFQDR